MNLPLSFGFLGAVEAGLIAFLIGALFLLLGEWLGKRFGLHAGTIIGWACVFAVLCSASLDSWNLFYLSAVQTKMQSPNSVRLVLATIHDPDSLGTRVTLELIGALCGVVACWMGKHGKFKSLWIDEEARGG